ncbi:PREDICTED: uncharacterized protein LOC105559370 [Vollenhovia emeryi]|uniref:uncharacterized protein LOC105559370 n=1 Tax=Vollenhovia emeryi TaxID=411798 RepID=UPI0005F57A55|nr:PREDICTED: uncharacterized protein LOC105559370 [Vollenhovia emeryi]
MGRGPSLSVEKRAAVTALRNDGRSVRYIAEKLNIPRSTVGDAITRFERTGCNKDKTRTERPRVTFKSEDQSLVLMPVFGAEFPLESRFSGAEVGRRDFSGLTIARTGPSKTGNEFYGLTNRSSKFLLKHGGESVMVWGRFSYTSVGDLHRIKGILEQKGYHSIPSRHCIPSGKHLIDHGFIMQQDPNDPKHTSKLYYSHLHRKEESGELKMMVCQSPDLNPIELLWDELDRRVRKVCPTS